MVNSLNKTLPLDSEREMRELRRHEGETILTIPLVVGLVIGGLEPLPIIIAARIEQVRIAIGNA